MLEKGKGFKDVKFGEVSADKLDDLNKLRGLEGVVKMDNGKVSIPADRVKHLYDQRVIGNNYSPEQVSGVLKNAVYGEGSVVSRGRLPQYQGMIGAGDRTSDVAVVGRHRNNGGVMVKTGYKKNTGEFNDKNSPDANMNLGGVQSSSSDPSMTSGSLLSARQGSNDGIVVNNEIIVNKGLEKSVQNLEKELGSQRLDDLINEMASSGRSGFEVGDETLLRLVQKARQKTPEAGDVIERKANSLRDAQHDRNYKLVNDIFGSRTSGQNIDMQAIYLQIG